MNSAHDPDPEYLSPTGAQIIEFVEEDETLSFGIALPCPECDQALEVSARAESIVETDLEAPSTTSRNATTDPHRRN
ncbi:MAG: hypothetical protein ACI9PP_000603 [Halobacteriales archaeon]|jgi:hypothetical protein